MVILNTVSLGLENMGDYQLNKFRFKINIVFTWIFIVELILKVYALGPKNYIQDKMNLFDAFIVATSILELLFVNDELPEIDENGNEIIIEMDDS